MLTCHVIAGGMQAKLNIVDLAVCAQLQHVSTALILCVLDKGSERLKKTASKGSTRKEAVFINKSLTFLEQVYADSASAQR